ncbi:MAG: CDGSH iron-sulfur domain-containing protein [Bacteroidales bacterium]|nr:CDGSH iron-sulfur domain-containing protein [Bacteroidales bacterium]MBN2699369.1 CDGSH iron-sulfur domain-containing protein [Bacteroidales bacterium]
MSARKAIFKVIPNGPLEITGTFTVLDSGGKEISNKGPVYLCRCGGSGNKPFCDGTHSRNGFTG